MVQRFQSDDVSLSSAAQINFPLPVAAGRSWQPALFAGMPNTNKLEGRVQPGRQRFLSLFQTYFLLFLESVHCALKNKGPIL